MEIFRIKELGNVVTGKTPETNNSYFFNGEFPFITPTDITFKTYYCRETEQTVTDLARQRFRNQFIPSNSILVTCIGSTIGKCAISSEDCLTNQQINSIIPFKKYNSKYIYYLMIYNTKLIRSIGLSGGVAAPIINKKTFEELKIKVHTKEESCKISLILSAYDDLIDINQKRIHLLEEAARLLYREWFVYFRFPGHENVKIVDGIPEGWEITRIKSIGEVVTGKTPSKKKPENFDGETPFIKTPDMHKASIILSTEETLSEIGASLQKNKTLPPWSILVSCIGSVGVVSMNLYKSQTNQQINSIIPKNRYFRYYLYFCLSRMKPLLEAIGGGSTMANINKSKFENLKIIKPAENLLVEFYKIATPIFEEIAVLLEQNQKLAQARDLLLPRLMSGKIDVSEFDKDNIPLESEVEKIVN